MSAEVQISTGCRLHFGLMSNRPRSGRQFGGAGLMTDSPGFQLAARPADVDAVSIAAESIPPAERNALSRRIVRLLASYRSACPGETSPPPCDIEIREIIPTHVGLGSGTQLAMTVAQACAALTADHADYLTLAQRAGRGARSAIGIHGFALGGFLIETGKREAHDIGLLAARARFPDEWRILLIAPPDARGISGQQERDAFAKLPPTDSQTTDRLCRVALLELLPAVTRADFDAACEAVYEFGRTVGEYFAPVQGGLFASADMGRLVAEMRAGGFRGVGQTSWGPTIFVFCQTQESAEQLVGELSASTRWHHLKLRVARPLNAGAGVTQRTCG